MTRRKNSLCGVRVCRLALGIVGALLVSIILFTSGTAKASPSWCVKELERSNDHIKVLHNPDCDLRVLPRMYPQKDDAGKILPMQQQLRSLFAANQTRVENGVKRRFTVMRGCVRPGKPSRYADAEEMQICPDGLMNYFSAPASDSAARIVVPVKRYLTIAEHNLAVASVACEQLQKLNVRDNEAEKAVENCKKEFPAMIFASGTFVPRNPKGPSSPIDNEKLQELRATNIALEAKLATIAPLANKGGFVMPLFIVLFGLAIFGASSTIVALKIRRDKKVVDTKYVALMKERNDWKVILRKEVITEYEVHLKAHKARVEEELKLAWQNLLNKQQKENNQLIEDNKKLRERVEELSTQIEDYRVSIIPVPIASVDSIKPQSKDAEQLQVIDNQTAEIRELRQESGQKDQQIADVTEDLNDARKQVAELNGEILALGKRNAELEPDQKALKEELAKAKAEADESHIKARDANREKVELEEKVTELNQDLDGSQLQVATLEASVEESEKRIDFLNGHVEKLMGVSGAFSMKQTLSLGIKADESAIKAEDEQEPDVATQGISKGSGSGYSMVLPKDSPEQHEIPQSIGDALGADDRQKPDAWNRGPEECTPFYDPDEMRRRASDSTRPLPGEGPDEVAHFPLERDPDLSDSDSPREEMPTLSEAADIQQDQILEEQVIHYRGEWLKLAQLIRRKLLPGLEVTKSSNTEQTYLSLETALQVLNADNAKDARRLRDAEIDRDTHEVGREKNAKRIAHLEEELREKNAELGSAQQVANALRVENDGMVKIIHGDSLQTKLLGYQLASQQAEQRALAAERARQDAAEELSRVSGFLGDRDRTIALNENQISLLAKANAELESRFDAESKTEGIPFWQEERKTDSGLAPDPNQAEKVSAALGLGEEDRLPAREVLSQLPQEELLRLASSVFYAMAEYIRAGEGMELPIGGMEDLYALHDVANIPLVSIYGFVMPKTLQNIAGHGLPRLYHTMHDTFRGPDTIFEEPVSMMTMVPPPTGVPVDRNSALPTTEGSTVRPRAAICPPPVKKDDKSRSNVS
jgi:hypothetical protein